MTTEQSQEILELYIGIDLGTTYSSIGFYDLSKDEPIIIQTSKETPSYVHFMEDSTQAGTIGTEAKEDPDTSRTCYDAKRAIGKKFEEIKEYAKTLCCKTGEHDGRMAYMMNFKTNDEVSEEYILPEEISGMVIQHLKNSLLSQFKDTQYEITLVAICVPCSFNTDQINATKLAARHAGFENVEIIHEPIASIYDFSRLLKKQAGKEKRKIVTDDKIVVIDFGGGTLDISCCFCKSINDFHAKYSDGDENLGGNEFDMCIKDIMLEMLDQNSLEDFDVDDYYVSINEAKESGKKNKSVELRKKNVARVKKLAEQTKKELSEKESVEIKISDITKNENHTGTITITRDDFREKSEEKGLLERFVNKLNFVMNKAQFQYNQVKHVLMVGGTCKIPFIQDIIKKKFNSEAIVPETFIKGLESVCNGCTIYAKVRSETGIANVENNIMVSQTLLHPVGIEKGGRVFDKYFDVGDIIPTGKVTKTYNANRRRTNVQLNLWKCDAESVLEQGSEQIGTMTITNIPAQVNRIGRLEVGAYVDVTLSITDNFEVKISANVQNDTEHIHELLVELDNYESDEDFRILHDHYGTFIMNY